MKAARWISGCLLIAGFVLGTYEDRAQKSVPITMGGYRVLAGDFHIHSFPLSWSTLSPWDTVIEAQRQGLDVIAMTGHNHVWVAEVGRWFSRRVGGPTVLVGEEIVGPKYHMLALGIEHTVELETECGECDRGNSWAGRGGDCGASIVEVLAGIR